jgi:sucrose-6-phosphate hydrolase SacC (GH32 family)
MWYIYGIKWEKFADSETPDRVYKIAHAVSPDGITWKREGRPIITDRLDADECQALPSVIHFNGLYHMYFCYRRAYGFRNQTRNSYRIGHAYSTDLAEWVRDDSAAGIDVSDAGWDSEMQCYPHVFRLDETLYMLYNGNQFGRFGFGIAVLDG